MTLPNGTPVGTASGSPTLVPAGYYSLLLAGPGGCTLTPYFVLKGPGVAVTDNMAQGEDEFTEHDVNFLPNSTYTWHNSETPRVVYTFTPPPTSSARRRRPSIWNGPTSGKKQTNEGHRRLRARRLPRHSDRDRRRDRKVTLTSRASRPPRSRPGATASSSPTRARRTA